VIRIDFNGDFPWGVVVPWTIFWLGILARILTREDFDTLQKLLWVVVTIFVPVFGVFLYLFIAPSEVREKNTIIPGSDVSGTPWAGNPSYTTSQKKAGKDLY
jgi:heme/copper-type cytochrome/quinol oxidase subunit 2